jgi:non-specific serine/threonine protein kinase
MTPLIVFDLFPFTPTLWLPGAWLMRADADGQPAHILQKATVATVAPFGLSLSEPQRRMLAIIELLSLKNVEAKHKPVKSKVAVPLHQLLADQQIGKIVEAYIHRHLNEFLSLAVQQGEWLTLHAEKRSLAKDVLVQFVSEPLRPWLFFKKVEGAGIEYRLELGTETQRFRIQERQAFSLTNTDPAWVVADYRLYQVPGIRGNMMRPFANKDVVLVPEKQALPYFRGFISKAVQTGYVEAEGFLVQQNTQLQGALLEPIENILEQQWQLKLSFEYEGVVFQNGEKRNRVTTLHIPTDNETGDITVCTIIRDEASENQKRSALMAAGFQESGGRFLDAATCTTAERTPLQHSLANLLEALAQHKAVLQGAGMTVVAPVVEDKTLALHAAHLQTNVQAAGDWFDITGGFQVGAFYFPFSALGPFLKRNDRFFPLPDGTFFLLPEEWMTRYRDVFAAAQTNTGQLRVPKAAYPLLQQAGWHAHSELPVLHADAVDYAPDSDLKADLRPYQLHGVRWLVAHYHNGLGACLADDMGLGKTLQTIALLLYIKAHRTALSAEGAATENHRINLFDTGLGQPLKALVILPSSLVFNWKRELSKFAPSLFVTEQTGPRRLKEPRALAAHDVVLTTYHTARQDLALLEKIQWQTIVIDESQQIKNRDSEVSKVVRSLKAPHKVSLSGTPIENSLADLWTQMEFINPDALGSFRSFREQFMAPIERNADALAKERLFQRVQPYFLRRTKEEVAPDLPPLSEQVFFTEMLPEQKKVYERLKSAVRSEILSLFSDPKTRFQAITALVRLRQMANHPVLADPDYQGGSGKMDDVLAQWETIRRARHKVLFFSSFEKHLRLYRAVLEAQGIAFVWLTGEVSASERAVAVTRFQEEPGIQAFFMTLKAGGVGLNLTAADYVFLLDPWWNPAAESQAVARAHRIGQQHPVTALRFIARDTVEEKILVLQEKKRLLGQALFDTGADTPLLTEAEITELLE